MPDLNHIREKMVSTGQRASSVVVREGKARIDPGTVDSLQRNASAAASRAAAAIAPHVPDSVTVQHTITNVSQQNLERVVSKTLLSLPPEARIEFGKFAQKYAAQTGIEVPRGLERGDASAVADVLARVLQQPHGVRTFINHFGASARGNAGEFAAIAANPVARQFLFKLLQGVTRIR